MAFSKTPTDWLGNTYNADANALTIPIDNFPELTAAEADKVTGDIRKILFALNEKFYTKFVSLPSADQPSKMVISKTIGQLVGSTVRVQYVIQFDLASSGFEVVDEP